MLKKEYWLFTMALIFVFKPCDTIFSTVSLYYTLNECSGGKSSGKVERFFVTVYFYCSTPLLLFEAKQALTMAKLLLKIGLWFLIKTKLKSDKNLRHLSEKNGAIIMMHSNYHADKLLMKNRRTRLF